MNLTEKVTNELKLIKDFPRQQRELRGMYYLTRLHHLGGKTMEKKSAKQVMEECTIIMKQKYPNFDPQYDKALLDIVDEDTKKINPDYMTLLKVCYDMYNQGFNPFAGKWVARRCQELGVPFHQAWLTKLVTMGFLIKGDSSRGGSRRYYAIKDESKVENILKKAKND